MRNITFTFLLLTLSSIGFSQVQVTSYFDSNLDKDSNPSDFIVFNNKLFFVTDNDSYGSEIWYKNDAQSNATLLKDINPGPSSGISYILIGNRRKFAETTTIFNGELYFIASDGTSNGDLWKTDGTEAGTVKVTSSIDFNIDYLNTNQVNFQLSSTNDFIFFIIKKDTFIEVWKSDGTNSGTELVKDNIQVSQSASYYKNNVNNLYIFTQRTFESNDIELWRSDGTEAGTFILVDDISGSGAGISGGSSLSHYVKYNNELYFAARYFSGSDTVIGIMKTDGTIENTVVVNDLFNVGINIDYGDVVEVNNKLYFSFFRINANHLFIWEYDPLTGTKQLVYDEDVDYYFMCSNMELSSNNTILFTGPDSNKNALLEFDPSDYSTTVIKELIDPQPFSFFLKGTHPNTVKTINSNTYFINQFDDSNTETRLGWISALTEVSTINIENLNDISRTIVFDNNLFFQKKTDTEGVELWKSDGSNINTIISDNINLYPPGIEPSANSVNFNLKRLNKTSDNIIFSASDPTNGLEPRSYSNLNDNNILLSDINSGITDSSAGATSGFIEYNGLVFFFAKNIDGDDELWKTDGTASGTTKVPGFIDGISYRQMSNFHVLDNGFLYFTGFKSNEHYLYATNGNLIVEVKSFGTGTNTFDSMVSNDDKIYFYNPTFSGSNLWVSDGTTDGTVLLKTFNRLRYFAAVGDEMFFSAIENSGGEQELWKTDGTTSGTIEVADIIPGISSEPRNLSPLNDNLIFSAYTEQYGRELWISDGTESGTVLLKDINLGNASAFSEVPFGFNSFTIKLNNEIIFPATDGMGGIELWKTDGTENGTVLLQDINAGAAGSNPNSFVKINNLIYLQATTEDEGAELWKTDGSSEGTTLVSDAINPGALGAVPQDMIALGDDLIFTATTLNSGRQLWKIENETLNLDDVNISKQSILFPNPTNSIVYIKTESQLDGLKVFDVSGKLVKTYTQVTNNQIDISELNSGIYFIQFTIGSNLITEKLIKKN
nr:T9SS type A sorting domain-containing protein [uncultured Psychroserpens sp.]